LALVVRLVSPWPAFLGNPPPRRSRSKLSCTAQHPPSSTAPLHTVPLPPPPFRSVVVQLSDTLVISFKVLFAVVSATFRPLRRQASTRDESCPSSFPSPFAGRQHGLYIIPSYRPPRRLFRILGRLHETTPSRTSSPNSSSSRLSLRWLRLSSLAPLLLSTFHDHRTSTHRDIVEGGRRQSLERREVGAMGGEGKRAREGGRGSSPTFFCRLRRLHAEVLSMVRLVLSTRTRRRCRSVTQPRPPVLPPFSPRLL
jgi:hypothetical protein